MPHNSFSWQMVLVTTPCVHTHSGLKILGAKYKHHERLAVLRGNQRLVALCVPIERLIAFSSH